MASSPEAFELLSQSGAFHKPVGMLNIWTLMQLNLLHYPLLAGHAEKTVEFFYQPIGMI